VVECTGLENRRLLTGLVSSNLTLSANKNNFLGTITRPESGVNTAPGDDRQAGHATPSWLATRARYKAFLRKMNLPE
jgi:hypothetical protein